MPHALHIQMNARQRRRLRPLRHDPRLRPRERDRVEMCLLSAQGWTAPRLAVHLDVCAATVRRWIRQWEARGLKSMRYARMGRPPAVAQRRHVFRALRRCLRRPQVWSSRTLSAALATQGLHLQPRTVRKYLGLMGPATSAPRPVCGTNRTRNGWRWPAPSYRRLKKARAGQLPRLYLDESGFSPSLPPTYTWSRPGTRPHVPYENTQGRRVHVVAALAAPGTTPTAPWTWGAAARTWKSEDVRDFLLYRLPKGQGQPRVVVLDHASCHRSQEMQQALPQLRDKGIELYFLPPYIPELNDIEPYFGRVKHQEMPIRSYTSTPKLIQTIHAAFRRVETDLITRQNSMPTA